MGRNFAVVGGDRRFSYLAGLLVAEGYSVATSGVAPCEGVFVPRGHSLERAAWNADCVILPLPMLDREGAITHDPGEPGYSLESVLELSKPGCVIMGGMVGKEQVRLAARAGRELVDYYQSEKLQLLNALPTAEGAVQLALERTPSTLFGSRCLVTGYGRVARRLVLLLLAMGAEVTVAARSACDLVSCRTIGCRTLDITRLREHKLNFELLFNTVPALILTGEVMSRLSAGCVIFDLASLPGGVDSEQAKNLGFTAIQALSLPGRFSPRSAAAAIKESIIDILTERGLFNER